MTNLQLRKEVRDGVEFFVSNDGDDAGMSLSGISSLTSVAISTISSLVSTYMNFGKLPSETLEDLRNKGFRISDVPVGNGSGKPVKFIPAEVCEAIIWYYANEAKRVSPEVQATARYSYRKFAAIGIKTWILQVTGFKSNDGQDLSGKLDWIISQLDEVKELSQRHVNLMERVQEQPGLTEILETYSQGYLLTDGQQFTLQTWLKAKGLELTHSAITRLGLTVGRVYEAHHRQPAPRLAGNKFGNKGFGKVNIYTTDDIPLLESALKTCLNG